MFPEAKPAVRYFILSVVRSCSRFSPILYFTNWRINRSRHTIPRLERSLSGP